jgi:hypothetical protein
MAAPVDPATRKRVLRVVFISLLLDLVSWIREGPLSDMTIALDLSSRSAPVEFRTDN